MSFVLPDYFYELNIISTTTRLLLALIIGGSIGLERGANKHPAGFRTHIMVCVGAALVMMTNQFCFDHFYTVTGNGDVVRLGAQVITGIGFLGAGTILIAGRERIKGLTTAAGLWASACIGLACGIGFYSGAIAGGILIFLTLSVLSKIEDHFYNRSRSINFYVEVDTVQHLKDIKHYLQDINATKVEAYLIRKSDISKDSMSFNITAVMPRMTNETDLRHEIEAMPGVFFVENF